MLPTRLKEKDPQPVRDKQGREVVHAHGLTPLLAHAHRLTPLLAHAHRLTPMLVHAHGLHVLGWCTRTGCMCRLVHAHELHVYVGARARVAPVYVDARARVARVCWCNARVARVCWRTRTGCTCMLAHAHVLAPILVHVLCRCIIVLCCTVVELDFASLRDVSPHCAALHCLSGLANTPHHSETVSCRQQESGSARGFSTVPGEPTKHRQEFPKCTCRKNT